MLLAADSSQFVYPRRGLIRRVLQRVTHLAFAVCTELEISGRENLPGGGPLLAVMNHFSFIDPALMIRILPWPLEFVGSPHMPNAPRTLHWLPRLWGIYPVFRGTGSRYALQAAQAVLAQGGVLGIAPEGGSWATVLRPARPGAAFLAAMTGARILPVGLDGLPEVCAMLRRGKRAKVTARIGAVFGPFAAEGRGRARRVQLDEIGHEIMRRIAELIPPERRGYYSDDPAVRAAAGAASIYPWETEAEELRG